MLKNATFEVLKGVVDSIFDHHCEQAKVDIDKLFTSLRMPLRVSISVMWDVTIEELDGAALVKRRHRQPKATKWAEAS